VLRDRRVADLEAFLVSVHKSCQRESVGVQSSI
jgi:hypothetical protein